MTTSDIALPPPIHCPWDSRRLPREMYVKLFVVHSVAIGAFGQLQHLRRERRGPFIYLLMIMCPPGWSGARSGSPYCTHRTSNHLPRGPRDLKEAFGDPDWQATFARG